MVWFGFVHLCLDFFFCLLYFCWLVLIFKVYFERERELVRQEETEKEEKIRNWVEKEGEKI